MSELPAGWASTTLSGISENEVDKRGPDPSGETFRYVDISSIDRTTKRIVEPALLPTTAAPSRARQNLRAGDVLVSMTRPNLNAVAKVSSELDGSIGSTGFHVLRARFVSSGWLYYRVQAPDFISAMSMRVQGALYPAVRPSDITQFATSLPPRQEQDRIVAEIDQQFTRLDAATAALKRVQANLRRYRASVLKAACEGRLVPTEAELARKEVRDYEPAEQLLQRILRERRARWESATLAKMIASGKPPKDDRWKQKYKEPVAPDTSALPKLPEGWCWASLSELSWACDYGMSNKCGYEGEGPPVLRIPNIQSGQIDFCDLKRAMRPMAVTEGDDLKPGDLLIIRTNGSKNLIGRCALIERSFERVTLHASYLIRFRTLTVGHWLRDIWDSSFNRSSIEALAATSAGQYNVSMTVLEKLAFPIPPLAEIERLRFKLTDGNLALRRAEAATDENLLRARSLRSGILSSAFAGQLTYQDSGDEPASALLERIRAEFASQLRRKLPRRRKEPVHV